MNRRRVKGFVLIIFLAFCLNAFGQLQEKFVTIFGAKIRYIEAGENNQQKVILLHGLGSSAEAWQMNVRRLSEKFHVFIPDQVGFGKSDKPFLKYRVATYVDFLDKFMSELKIEKAHIIGNSMGGWIAALMALKYPDKVEKLVLVAPAGLLPERIDEMRVYQLNNSTRDEIRDNMKRIFASPLLQNNEALVDQFLTQRVLFNDGYTISSLIESIRRKEDFLNGKLNQIKKQTLIIWGRQDGLLPVSDAYVFNKEIASSKLVIFDNCGHVPQLEKAEDFNRLVEEFLISK
ncbi:MAG: alpha/beta hydrolase [Pyrinomonadaceae bacterium]|nr:alpha/beta hydrolase [Pyrinomonadaceae bacterium]MCX7640024.1 alpha/beta hydrolase [Pyrinomonadaceae bacterium]MDW8304196.1 alpha/beta hydrolase [Acidobacteriota bacterium]